MINSFLFFLFPNKELEFDSKVKCCILEICLNIEKIFDHNTHVTFRTIAQIK